MRGKKHIVYIVTKLELGGAQKVCLALLKGMLLRGYSASLISGSQGVLVDEVRKNFNSIFLLPSFKHSVSLFSVYQEVKNFFIIVRILRKLKKQSAHIIVHTHSTKAGVIGRWATFFAGIPRRIHTVHGWGFNDYQAWLRWLIIYWCELLTSFITTNYVCVSLKDQDEGLRRIPGFNKKSSIIRAAVDWDTFYLPAYKDSNLSQENIVTIGTIACFKPQKNLFDLLKAFACAHERLLVSGVSLRLQIIGDGLQRTAIESWIEKKHLKDCVTLMGWRQDVALNLRMWNVFVLTSLWEGLPCSVIEARLSKLPVVAYDVGGISEIIQSGVNGFLVQPGDWELLAQKIVLLATDSELYKRMISFSDDLSAFDNKTMVKLHDELYQFPDENNSKVGVQSER